MTVDEARAIILSMPEAYESSHHGHPDFRIKKGIFATLWPDKGVSVLRLPQELAESEAQNQPDTYRIAGRAGGMGWLGVTLDLTTPDEFKPLVEIAWQARL